MTDVELLDRIRGCLLGGAAGDALGYAVEFITAEMIRDFTVPRASATMRFRRAKP